MNLFGKLLGKKPDVPKPSVTNSPTSADLRKDPNLIRVYDKYGQKLFITKDQWRTNVLPGTIKSNWTSADGLYAVIISALNDGFMADVMKAAEQLHRIDPIPSRGACIHGIVLMKNKRLDEAARVLLTHLQKHGDDGSVLTNLAKVYAEQNRMKEADDTLWHALEVDPNQDNGLGWYEAIHRERGGDQAGLEALSRIAALPGSWRAQVWLARAALKSEKLEEALAYYAECLSRADKHIPADLLMQISGDLGNQGHLAELLRVVEPHFVVETHGLQVGNNLIKAHLDLGHIEDACQIMDQLYALKRPDWKETLSHWDTEIAKARITTQNIESQTPLKSGMLVGEGPVWLKPSSPAAELFKAKSADAPIIVFLGSSAEMPNPPQHVQHQIANPLGRLSRALPLFLAEQVTFATVAGVRTLVLWIEEKGGGFVLSGVAWSDEDAISFGKREPINGDYVVATHLKAQTEPWTVTVRLLRTADGKCLGNLEASVDISKSEDTIPTLARQLLTVLACNSDVKSESPSSIYQLPAAHHLNSYLLRLEQLLAVRCSSMGEVQPHFLSGEREIIDGNILLCVACPDNVVVRILLAQTLLAMKDVRPDIVKEFADNVALLQKEHPLKEPAYAIVQRMLDEGLA